MMNFCLPVSTFSETFGHTSGWLRRASSGAQRFGALLGYYYFLVFLAFVAPKKKAEK
jgi:hypothetical protein